ncbi:Major facilitator superfamily domain containing protein [Amanita muscaria]
MAPSMAIDVSRPESEETSEHDDLDQVSDNINRSYRTPLPWTQLSIVFLIQFAEPVTATVIYPFINQFVRETGITKGDERKTGYFAGIIQSAFFFAEAISVVFWGMASDRFGRRLVLLYGPLGLALVMLLFGMSTQFWPLVALRGLQGAFNGNIGVSKSIIGEITDSTNMADAFAFIPVVWTSGITIGPFIGGFLARPAERWPDIFGQVEYLKSHPYFLSCLGVSCLAFSAFLAAVIALKETLPSAMMRRKRKNSLTAAFTDDDVPHYGSTETRNRDSSPVLRDSRSSSTLGDEENPPNLRSLLKLREVQIVLINYAFLGFCDMGLQSLTALMWSTSIENGGLGFTSYTIGMIMGTYGVVNAVLQASFLGKIIRRFGPRKVHIFCFSSMLVSFSSFPVANFFARRAHGSDWRVWATVIVSLVAQSSRGGSYGVIQIILTASSPTRSSLGTMNGLGQAVACIMKSLGPSIASSLHSISLQRQLIGGNAVYYIMTMVVAFGIQYTFMLPKKLKFQ